MSAFRRAAVTVAPPDETPLGLNEAALYRAMLGLFWLGGFSAVVQACARQQKRIARENRANVLRQGWVV